MALRTSRFSPSDTYYSTILHVIVFILLSGGIRNQVRIGIASSLPTEKSCKNSLITRINETIYVVTSDIHMLDTFWNTCRQSTNAATGRGLNPEIIRVCGSTHFNLEILCNTIIPEEKLTIVEGIWKNPYTGNNICQGNNISILYASIISA